MQLKAWFRFYNLYIVYFWKCLTLGHNFYEIECKIYFILKDLDWETERDLTASGSHPPIVVLQYCFNFRSEELTARIINSFYKKMKNTIIQRRLMKNKSDPLNLTETLSDLGRNSLDSERKMFFPNLDYLRFW